MPTFDFLSFQVGLLFYLSLQIAFIAIVYICILPHERPFDSWFRFGFRKFGKTWLYKPLFDCEKCFAGQTAFWYYLFQFWGNYSLLQHLYFTAQTILLTFLVCKLYHLIKEKL